MSHHPNTELLEHPQGRARGEFELIHHRAPLTLAQACIEADVAPFVQISALGDPADGECIASKHHLDDALQSLPLALLVPVHRPECLLVFVLGTTVGFGTMLPTLFGSLMALATVVIHRFIGMPLQRLVGLQKATSPQGLE